VNPKTKFVNQTQACNMLGFHSKKGQSDVQRLEELGLKPVSSERYARGLRRWYFVPDVLRAKASVLASRRGPTTHAKWQTDDLPAEIQAELLILRTRLVEVERTQSDVLSQLNDIRRQVLPLEESQ
jgi:hypothetical protein